MSEMAIVVGKPFVCTRCAGPCTPGGKGRMRESPPWRVVKFFGAELLATRFVSAFSATPVPIERRTRCRQRGECLYL